MEQSPFTPQRPQLPGPSRSSNDWKTYSEDRRDEEENWSDESGAPGTTHPGDTPRRQTRRHDARSHLSASYIPAVPGGQAVPYGKHQNPFAPPPQFSYGNGYPPPPTTGYFSPPPQPTPPAYAPGGSYFSPGGYGPQSSPLGDYGPGAYPSPRSPYERPTFKEPSYEYSPRSPLSPHYERRRDSIGARQEDYRSSRREERERKEEADKARRAAARERIKEREKEQRKKMRDLQRRLKELEMEKKSRREAPREDRDLIEYLPLLQYMSTKNAEDMQRRQLASMPPAIMMLFRDFMDRQAEETLMPRYQYQDRLPYAGLPRPRPSTRSSFGSGSRDGYDDDLRSQIQEIVRDTLLNWQVEEEPERAGLPEAGRAMSEETPSHDGYPRARDYDEEPPYSPSAGTAGRDDPFLYSETGRRGGPRRSTTATPQPERRPRPERKSRGPTVQIEIPAPGKRPRSDTTSDYSAASARGFKVPLESPLEPRFEPKKTATRRPLGEGSSQTASRTAASTVAPGIRRRKSQSGKRPGWVDPGLRGVNSDDEDWNSEVDDYEDRLRRAPYSMTGGNIHDSRLNPREDLLPPAVPEAPTAGSSNRPSGSSRRAATPRSVTIEDVEEDLRYMEASRARDRHTSRPRPERDRWSDSDRG